MVTTIRILRRKCHDIECIYVLEFLKLIGCLVFDRVFPNDISRDINEILTYDELYEKYDVNICYGVLRDVTLNSEEMTYIYIKPENNKDQKKNARKFLHELVKNIWCDKQKSKDKLVYPIMELYEEVNIFTYLYNKGNLKFIREYITINSDDVSYSDEANEKSVRKDMCDNTYSKLLNFYQILIDKEIVNSVYLQFAKINLAQDLNETRELAGNGRVFRTDYMINTLNHIQKDYPEMIRCYYLAGVICNFNNQYLIDSYSYFQAAIDKAKEIDLPKALLGLIYYQIGRFLEKRQRVMSSAYEAYSRTYISNPYMMRALYRMTVIEHSKGDYEKAIKHANEAIRVLLNGYPMEDAMPGQQLYAYKNIVLLGDIYQTTGRHELAIRCYKLAIELAKTKSKFYRIWNDIDISFEHVQKMCMPIQPIYFKMINCATMCNELDQSAEYYRMLWDENN